MSLNRKLVGDLLATCAAAQRGHAGIESSGPDSPAKAAAKRRATALIATVASRGQRVVEIGAEENYRPLLEEIGLEVDPINLPSDMHDLDARDRYDGAIAMHVLEHSPFPLYILAALHRAVRAGGWLYVAVPHVTRRWARDAAHFSVLHPDAWVRLLEVAGWEIRARESGKLAERKNAVEERFLCVRAA